METFTVIAFIWLGANHSPSTRGGRDASSSASIMKMQIDSLRRQTAWCEIQERPKPV
jgi:hypothetical protein